MGQYISKLLSHVNESQEESIKEQISQQTTEQNDEIYTPTLPNKKLLLDPRSASAGISRTPIEVNDTPIGTTKKNLIMIPKYLQQKQYLETDIDAILPPLSPKKRFVFLDTQPSNLSQMDEVQNYLTPNVKVIKDQKGFTSIDKERFKILGLDPRSPAADFDRTPILMPKSLALLKARSQQQLNRQGSYETDTYNSKSSYQKMCASLHIPEIQLLPDIVSEDLKALNLEKGNESNVSNIPQFEPNLNDFMNNEELTAIKNLESTNERSKSSISDEYILNTNKEEENTNMWDNYKDVIEQNTEDVCIKDYDKIEIWHDPMSSEENLSGKMREKGSIEKKLSREKVSREDVIITFDIMKNTSPKVSKIEENIQVKEDIRRKKVTGKKKEIFKIDFKHKLDEEKIISSDNRYNNEAPKNRTPLGNRSNNDRIQGMPTKSPQQLSKNKTVITEIQQENTPLRSKHTRKFTNKMQWDSNSTVII